ncbi:MAG: internalization-related competence protein ComEC/Rec2 [Anaerosolibacter sp.]|jgi:competence protein ComEC|uniref:DNA internalization-related competence protein ComEC/Rec2 n=1 Tax=Anaerosolibacter sp. TaxID=1872527 RepID=UPI0026373DBC|nr:DNA internalization-related competence protein ComEC/Rec2 [Anaerosolibacter sp.]MDF2548127.1 internalization-related competence protein ComEC/Rec2 [Anaerosolibacter sp.]
MRRPLIPIVAAYAAGIVLRYWINNLYILGSVVFLVVFSMGIVLKKSRHTTVLLCIFLLAGVGNLTVKFSYVSQLAPYWNQEAYIIGDVINVAYGDTAQLKLQLKEINLHNQSIRLSETTLVMLTGEVENDENIVGKRVAIHGMIREPQGPRNFKTFDYRMYLKIKNIHSLVYGTFDGIDVIGKGEINPIIKASSQIKYKIAQVIFRTLEKREAGLLLGILLGDRDQLDDAIYESFQLLGTAHVLAVSGLHVGILYMALNYLLKKMNIKIKTAVILMILWSYASVTGFSSSVLRAVTMAMFLLMGPSINRKYDALSSLLAAAFLFLIINPLLIIDIGFQLSFAAVISIILLYPPILRKINFVPKYWAELLGVSLAAQAGTWPIIAYHFNVLSLASVFVNIPIVLIVGYLVPIGIVLTAIGVLNLSFTSLIGFIVTIIIQLMLVIVDISVSIPFAFLWVPSPSLWFMVAYVVFIGILIMGESMIKKYQLHRKKCLYGLIILCMTLLMIKALLPHPMEVIFVDVGQGDCTLIRTSQRKNILIDGGGNFQQGVVQKEKDIIVPYLFKNGISKIDIMFASHGHNDHIGGLIQVLDKIKVRYVVVGTEAFKTADWIAFEKKCKEKNVGIYTVKRGSEIVIDKDTVMKVLHPAETLIQSSRDDVNNNSLVLLMEYKNKRLLWTGDIEAEAENMMMDQYPSLDVHVVKVPHHGSVYSSTEQWIERITPEISVFQVGRNSFGHPHPKVIERYEKNNSLIFRNDENGGIRLRLDREKIEVYTSLSQEMK